MHRRYTEARLLLPALLLSLLLLSSCGLSRGRGTKLPDPRQPLKRELRAAWLPTIYRSEYAQLSPYDAADLLLRRVETLHQLGCNAIFFQVRAEGDAWYPSALEPWSKYVTGRQGQAPEEPWDPLELVIEACHERGMELHAWINPYRGASNASAELAPTHPARRYPELFLRYGGQLLMNPGHPQSIPYITSVVKDLVMRYDLDGLHFDDYFYPYPKAGEELQDEETFRAYGLGKGYARGEKARWRRDKVNELIRATRETLLELRPWMRFGVSPFGIYRNASSAPEGSQTAGLQSYDHLSADVLYWAHEGWVDYVVPQVYWNRGHKVADYDVLVPWWAEQLPRTTQLYIGQHVGRTMEGRQLGEKLQPPLRPGQCMVACRRPPAQCGRHRRQSLHQLPALPSAPARTARCSGQDEGTHRPQPYLAGGRPRGLQPLLGGSPSEGRSREPLPLCRLRLPPRDEGQHQGSPLHPSDLAQ